VYLLNMFLILSVLLICPSDIFAKMYVWTDENGKTHFSEKPPPLESKKAKILREYETIEDKAKSRGLYDKPSPKSRYKKPRSKGRYRRSKEPQTDYFETPKNLPPSIYDDFFNGVVVIRSSHGIGTGFFVSNSGLMVTNYHVVGSDRTVSIKTKDLKTIMGAVIAFDKKRDLALISSKYQNLACLKLAESNEGGVGSDVVAIGTPSGLDWSISKGIVSSIRKMNGIRVIQTDAAINPGNSGGPLISIQTGSVIGINTSKLVGVHIEGLNFAVSVQELMKAFPDFLIRK